MDRVLEQVNTLADLDTKMAKCNMTGQWKYDDRLEKAKAGPTPAGVPFIWRWQTVNELLLDACKVMPESFTARRTLALNNPGVACGGTTHTLLAAIQMVMPGELAWAHRHSISALRFCIEGTRELFSVVNGEALVMEPNDLILTPPLSWHDHHNESSHCGVWLDVLDLPLVAAFNQISYSTLGESAQELREQPKDDVDYRPQLVKFRGTIVPAERQPFRYPWSDVGRQLSRLSACDGSPLDGVVLQYINPLTGGPALPTMSCNIQMLRPGLVTQKHRKSSSSICLVVEGSGTTVFDDQQIKWGERDVFSLPDWVAHHHINDSKSKRAVLFVVNDAPLLKIMGLYREETMNREGRN